MDLFASLSEEFPSPELNNAYDFSSYLISDDMVTFVACPKAGESVVRIYILHFISALV